MIYLHLLWRRLCTLYSCLFSWSRGVLPKPVSSLPKHRRAITVAFLIGAETALSPTVPVWLHKPLKQNRFRPRTSQASLGSLGSRDTIQVPRACVTPPGQDPPRVHITALAGDSRYLSCRIFTCCAFKGCQPKLSHLPDSVWNTQDLRRSCPFPRDCWTLMHRAYVSFQHGCCPWGPAYPLIYEHHHPAPTSPTDQSDLCNYRNYS